MQAISQLFADLDDPSSCNSHFTSLPTNITPAIMVSYCADSSMLSLINNCCSDNGNPHQSELISHKDYQRNGISTSSTQGDGCPLLITSWDIWRDDVSQQSICVPNQKSFPAPQNDPNATGYGDGGWPSIFVPSNQKHQSTQ